MNRRRNRRSYLLVVALACFAWPELTLYGQQANERNSAKAPSYGFVSPNVRDSLSLQDAISGLDSHEEFNLIKETRTVACRLGVKASVTKAIGSWSDGAEHSTIIRITAAEPAIRFAVAALGKLARQKSVLYFRRSQSGRGRMYVLLLPAKKTDLRLVARELGSAGIEDRTLVPLKSRVMIYIVDLENDFQTKVRTAARRLRAHLTFVRGSGAFIGDPKDRNRAQEMFAEVMKTYEIGGPPLKKSCKRFAFRRLEFVLGKFLP
jgi:hypothetical protein